jgi:glutamyl-tRNA synthetase
MTNQIVTRFAPSPTGFLHIGGARTALFNWLYAKAKGGRMLLRIEDTDRQRSSEEAVEAILAGLKWLELDWDGEPVFQHAHQDRHREVADTLLAEGKAYKCYCSSEELTEMREKARAEGRPPVYDGRWRDRDPGDAPPDVDPVIRFKSPREGETVIDDAVQGPVRVANSELDDLIILRSDGTPTYMLSVVVDDHDMGITHVIRGDDHLTNAARQSQLFAALDWQTPQFSHVPLIHGSDGAKLSKRHGALGVEAYRDMGYLPAALRNYLVRLGWSHGDDEIFSTEELIKWFDLDAIGRAPARFDFAKLESLNSHYINTSPDETLIAAVRALPDELLNQHGLVDDAENWQKLTRALPVLKPRARTLIDIIEGAQFLLATRPLEMDTKADKVLNDQSIEVLKELLAELETSAAWDVSSLERDVRGFIEARDIKMGTVAQPLRAALTGSTTSPGIFDVLALLGRDEALERIRDRL